MPLFNECSRMSPVIWCHSSLRLLPFAGSVILSAAKDLAPGLRSFATLRMTNKRGMTGPAADATLAVRIEAQGLSQS